MDDQLQPVRNHDPVAWRETKTVDLAIEVARQRVASRKTVVMAIPIAVVCLAAAIHFFLADWKGGGVAPAAAILTFIAFVVAAIFAFGEWENAFGIPRKPRPITMADEDSLTEIQKICDNYPELAQYVSSWVGKTGNLAEYEAMLLRDAVKGLTKMKLLAGIKKSPDGHAAPLLNHVGDSTEVV